MEGVHRLLVLLVQLVLLMKLGWCGRASHRTVEVPTDPHVEVIEAVRNVSFQVCVVTFLENRTVDFCSGVIIESRHILTAASCILKAQYKGIPKVQVIVQHGSELQPKYSTFDVVAETFYEKQPKEHVVGDIVILQTDRPMLSHEEEMQIIPLQSKKQLRSRNCSLTGWVDNQKPSYTGNNSIEITPLKPLWKLHAVKKDRCFTEDYKHKPPEDLLCVGKLGLRRDTCQEDTGAPVVCDGALTGVVLGIRGCSNQTFAHLYSDVGYYGAWLRATLRQHARREQLGRGAWERYHALALEEHLPPRRRRRHDAPTASATGTGGSRSRRRVSSRPFSADLGGRGVPC